MLRAKFRHMQILVALAELGSMRRAAAALHMTQPAISQMVAELERLIDTDLFHRHARGVVPTAAAKELLPAAQSILSTLDDAAERMSSRIEYGDGFIRIAATQAAAGAMLLGRLEEFNQRFPDTHLQIVEPVIETIASGLALGEFDVICTRRPLVVPEGWQFVDCVEDRLTVIAHPSHPLAGQGKVDARAFGEAVWLDHRVGSAARARLEDAFKRHGWPVLRLCRINAHIPELTRELLEGGRRLSLMPRSIMLPWLQSGELVEIQSDLTQTQPFLGCLWRPETTVKAVQDAVLFLQEAALQIDRPPTVTA
ncbi:LysR family transcriptional regulator [Yoonia sp. R78084]|uniref:LysR family transcriptional regulator n=1 Tax=Yoonia sp. R78084 TaxID=3093869 RepID=UPI0037DC52DD